MRTNGSPRLTLLLGGDGEGESGYASSPYGPVRAGLTTTLPTNKEVQLSESLNYLEREVETLESRFYEACVTLNLAMARLVELGLIGIVSDHITTEEEEC